MTDNEKYVKRDQALIIRIIRKGTRKLQPQT